MHRASSHPILPHAVSPQLHPIKIYFGDQVIGLFLLRTLRVRYIASYPSMGICSGISAANELLENLIDPCMDMDALFIGLFQE